MKKVHNIENVPLVIVEWLDSYQAQGEWQWIKNAKHAHITQCCSCGFLVSNDDYQVRIAVSVGSIDGVNPQQASGIVGIPTCSITKMTRIFPNGKTKVMINTRKKKK